MDIHKDFMEWAIARGVTLNGIAAHRFPGKGVGIIAEKELKVCRQTFMLRSPMSYLYHRNSFLPLSLDCAILSCELMLTVN